MIVFIRKKKKSFNVSYILLYIKMKLGKFSSQLEAWLFINFFRVSSKKKKKEEEIFLFWKERKIFESIENYQNLSVYLTLKRNFREFLGE